MGLVYCHLNKQQPELVFTLRLMNIMVISMNLFGITNLGKKLTLIVEVRDIHCEILRKI